MFSLLFCSVGFTISAGSQVDLGSIRHWLERISYAESKQGRQPIDSCDPDLHCQRARQRVRFKTSCS